MATGSCGIPDVRYRAAHQTVDVRGRRADPGRLDDAVLDRDGAGKGYVNGFYYPLVYQEHMDDPKSEYSRLKDEESYQAAKAVTFNLNYHGQDTLDDRWVWRQKVLDNLLDDPWDVKHYTGWRGRLRRVRSRLSW